MDWWHALSFAVLILQPLIFYRRHLFRFTAHIPFDIQDFHLPLTAFIARSVKEHVWPFWNPLVYCGVPIHADIQAQLFYPLTWMAILLDRLSGGGRLFYWLEWLVPTHMIIAGIGAYLLLRRFRCSALVGLFGATVFQIGPFFVSQAQHLGSISTAAWFPIVLLYLSYLAEGFNSRWLGAVAIAVSMSILGGFPATTIVILAISGLFCVALIAMGLAKARLLALFIVGCLLGAALTALQLIPSLQLSSLSVASLRYQWRGNGGGMPWESLASLFWPNYYHIFSGFDAQLYKQPYNFTFMYTFCGHAALVLIAMAPFFLRKSKLLAISAGLFAFSAIWMLGENTPIYPSVVKLLPRFLQGALYAESALLGFSMFAAATAALVLSKLEPRMHRLLLVALVAANSWNVIRIGANKVFNTFDGSYEVASANWVEAGLPMPGRLRTLTQAGIPPLRIGFLSDAAGLLQAGPGLLGLSSADGDNPFLLLRYYHLRHTFSDDSEWSRRQFPRNLNSPWIQALNVGFVIENENDPNRAPADDRYELLPFSSSVRIYKVKDPLPRFSLRNRVLPVNTEEEALAQIKNPEFDVARQAIVEGLRQNWKPDEAALGSVKVLSYENNRIDLDIQTSGRVLLVTSEALYPGWTATVNGRPADILATNVAFRGVALEPGKNHVVMTYFPNRLIFSMIVTLLAFGLIVFLFAGQNA
jgi:Bacterial membrane protein YfhO